MDNVNKPAAISVAATVIVCIAAVTLLVLLGGLAWWLWAMDRATQWETLRPLIATGFIIWGMALSLLVLGFMAFRLLIKDKVKPSAAPVRQPTRPAGREALYAPLKKHLHARYRLRWRRKVRLLLVTGDEAEIEQLAPGLRQQQWLEGNRTVLIYGGNLITEPDQEKYAALRKPWPSSGRDCAGDAVVSHPDAADKRERPARAGKNQRTAGLCRPGLVVETMR
ncbi:hypothetical protein KPZU09_18770 [Klebsiella pneumoniae]|uniref:Type VI secretion protein VasK n=1 Tax=Klebsiella pneumoniae TaxID=573 RepID=A0A919HY10_KLEPN|nr:hypothetical protein KPZU09_18770 [Klebsiella pneumoniae]